MKLGHLLMTTSLCAAMAGPALAEGRTFSAVDADDDGMLSMEELTDVFGEDGAVRILQRGDDDGDGMLSMDEVRGDDESDDDEDDEDDDDDDDDDGSNDDENDESDDDDSDESDDSSDDEDDED